MKKLFFEILLLSTILIHPQDNEWKLFNTSNSPLPTNNINCLNVDRFNNVWVGTDSGLTKISNGQWTNYNQQNSDIPVKGVYVIQPDKNGVIWLNGQDELTHKGLISFNGDEWEEYNTSNSPIPSNIIRSIAIDSLNNKWLLPVDGTTTYLTIFDGNSNWASYPGYYYYAHYGEEVASDSANNIWTATEWFLAKFDGANYSFIYTSGPSLGYYITDVKIDKTGNIWIAGGLAGWGGLSRFDGSNFAFYHNILAVSLEVDHDNNLWIGTFSILPGIHGELIKYNGISWTHYTTENSPLPANSQVNSIKIDKLGNVWLALYSVFGDSLSGGLVQFREGGIITSAYNEKISPSEFSLEQNYPNPFNPTTSIQYAVISRQFVSLKVYDVLGNEVATLVNKEMQVGSYEAEFDGSELTSGVYFYKLQAGNFIKTKKMILIK